MQGTSLLRDAREAVKGHALVNKDWITQIEGLGESFMEKHTNSVTTSLTIL